MCNSKINKNRLKTEIIKNGIFLVEEKTYGAFQKHAQGFLPC
jgi:hypothetical protein